MGNVKQPVLLQQGQLVFIECEIGTVITSVCYLLLPRLFRLLKCSRYILRQPLWCDVSRGASKNPTFIWDQCKIISRILISSGINSYGSSCVCVCVSVCSKGSSLTGHRPVTVKQPKTLKQGDLCGRLLRCSLWERQTFV